MRPAARLAALVLLAGLGGCAVFSTPDRTGGDRVAGHLDYAGDYLAAGESERRSLIRGLEDSPDPGAAGDRLRHAIVLSLAGDADRLAHSLELLEELQASEALTPAERRLARVWHGEVSSRLDLARENADIRAALEQAQRKLDQLTRIEEQLEAQDNGSGEQ